VWAISAENIGVWYPFIRRQKTQLRDWLSLQFRLWRQKQIFWALQGISFSVKEGEVLGVVGRNGSGKSTLLRVLAGVLQPDTGRLDIHGHVSALMSLGAGFQPELTGRENVLLNATFLGLPRRTVEARFDEIVAFAELEEFIDMPVRTYSSGMRARLGFAIASVVEPDILLLDEILGVGDAAFRQKSQERMKEMLLNARTIVVATHDASFAHQFCQQVLWLEKGRMAAFGAPTDVLPRYLDFCGTSAKQASTHKRHLLVSSNSPEQRKVLSQS
jgi:ABC-type polysaccharide/polyol phosphate transport system ATPase subunit